MKCGYELKRYGQGKIRLAQVPIIGIEYKSDMIQAIEGLHKSIFWMSQEKEPR